MIDSGAWQANVLALTVSPTPARVFDQPPQQTSVNPGHLGKLFRFRTFFRPIFGKNDCSPTNKDIGASGVPLVLPSPPSGQAVASMSHATRNPILLSTLLGMLGFASIASPSITAQSPSNSGSSSNSATQLGQNPTAVPEIAANDLPTKEPTKFLRMQYRGKEPISLETANTSYTNAQGLRVDLIGAIHVGEKSYYQKLNRQFDDYDVVLYELVAEEGTVIPKNAKREGASNPVSFLQGSMQSMLGLESQLEQIDYTRSTFVRADMTPAQIAERMKERGDTAVTVALSAMADILREANLRSQQGEASSQANQAMQELSLMDLFGDSKKLKQMMASQFVTTGSLDQSLGKTLNQMLILDRNAEALKGLTKQIAAGKKKIAIFYGAAHLPDFEKHLLDEFGLRRDSQEWVVAWDLQRGKGMDLESPMKLLETLFGAIE